MRPYKDFFCGIFKPVKDSTVSFVSCSCLTQLSIISPGDSYALWFAGIFSIVSMIDDIASGHFLDKEKVKLGYYHPINAYLRIFGMLAGLAFVWIFLTVITGIDIFVAIFSIIFPILFLIIGIILRMSMSKRIRVQQNE